MSATWLGLGRGLGPGPGGPGFRLGQKVGVGVGFGLEPVSATRRKVWAPRPTPSVTGAT